MKPTARFFVCVTFIVALVLPGCYTVIMHPRDEDGYRISQVSDCTSCHGDFHQYPYGYYYSPHPSYWWEYPRYGAYYAHPWWWSHYDYPYLDGDYASGDDRHTGTKFDRRDAEATPPPYSHPDRDYEERYPTRPQLINPPNIGNTGGAATGSGSSGSGSSDGSRSRDSGSSGESKNVREGTKNPRSDPEDKPAAPKRPTRKENPLAEDRPDSGGGKK